MNQGKSVYVLQHTHVFDDDNEDVKFIGVYSTHDLAQQAIDRLVTQPGFRDTPDGFCIDVYPLDKDHWSEGYATMDC